jgi:hypothetical protein
MPAEAGGGGSIATLKDVMQIISPIASFALAFVVFWFTRSMKHRDIQREARANFEDCLDNLLKIRQERALLAVDRPDELSKPSFSDVNRAFNGQRNYYVNRAIEILNRHSIELYPREKMLIADELFDEGRIALATEYINDAIKIGDDMPHMRADALRAAGRRLHAIGRRTVGVERILESIYVLKELSDSTPRPSERIYYTIAETYCMLADLKLADNERNAAAGFIELAKEAAEMMPSGVNRSRMDAIVEQVERRIANCEAAPLQ